MENFIFCAVEIIQNFVPQQIISKEIDSITSGSTVNKPTPNICFEKLFGNTTLRWSKIQSSPHLATWHYLAFFFLYKYLKNVLFLNKKLYTFGITNTPLCSFCNTSEGTSIQIYFGCIHVKRLQTKFQNGLILLSVASQTVILALYDKASIKYNLLSHVFLILRYCIYISREKRILNIRYSNC